MVHSKSIPNNAVTAIINTEELVNRQVIIFICSINHCNLMLLPEGLNDVCDAFRFPKWERNQLDAAREQE